MPPPRAPQPTRGKDQTVEFRSWKGANLTDARTDIGDDELFWNENAITIGKGSIQILPKQAAAVATIGAGVSKLFGFTLSGNPRLISINNDGSLSQITTAGVVTAVAGANTVTTAAQAAIWQSSPILIVDPTKGYFSWDGTTFTTISAGQTHSSIAVFEGRVFLGNNRTITYTAPNTYNDFTAGNGAGSTILTDEAFPGNIIALESALEELWIVGQGAIDALANVTASGAAPNVTTSFSITNIVSNLGSNAKNSVIGYFRALALVAPFGVYALSGVTPQKLSDKLDGLFNALTVSGDIPAAVATLQNLQCLLFLVTYTPSTNVSLPVPQSGAAAAAPLLLGFTQGKWFVATQGALTWITTLIVGGVSQVWGTDGSTIYQCFGAATTTAVAYKIMSKLYGFGEATTEKALTKIGIEYQANNLLNGTLTIQSESGSQIISTKTGNTLTLINNANGTLTLINNANGTLTLIAAGLVLLKANAPLFGHYLGWQLAGSDPPFRLQAVELEFTSTRKWSTP